MQIRSLWPVALVVSQLICLVATIGRAQDVQLEPLITGQGDWVETDWVEPDRVEAGTNTHLIPLAQDVPTSLAEHVGLGPGPTLGHDLGYAVGPFWLGVGSEWLDHAPFEMDRARPLNGLRIRLDAAYEHEFPDRAEFFWARIGGGGPGAAETGVDYQDIRFRLEQGTDKFSVATEIPLRVLDPEVNANTAGLADMSLTTKTVLFDGQRWLISQVFKSHFNTGARTHGLGNGHISLEPGMLFRYKWSEFTFLHSEIKYWFPLGADPMHSGEVIRYGFGISHIYYDSDAFAIIPTLELVNWWVMDGRKTVGGAPVEIDGEGILNLYPGVRFLFDSATDCRVWDFGVSGGFALTDDHWYQGLLRADLRWKW